MCSVDLALRFLFFADSSNSGGENMYTMMKPVPGGNMPGVSRT